MCQYQGGRVGVGAGGGETASANCGVTPPLPAKKHNSLPPSQQLSTSAGCLSRPWAALVLCALVLCARKTDPPDTKTRGDEQQRGAGGRRRSSCVWQRLLCLPAHVERVGLLGCIPSKPRLRETLPTSKRTGREQVLLGHAAALRGPRGPQSHSGSPIDCPANLNNEPGSRV